MKEWKIFRHKSLMPLCTLKKNPKLNQDSLCGETAPVSSLVNYFALGN